MPKRVAAAVLAIWPALSSIIQNGNSRAGLLYDPDGYLFEISPAVEVIDSMGQHLEGG